MPPTNPDHTRPFLIRQAHRYAQENPGAVTLARFCAASGIPQSTIALHFGTFPEFLIAAGLGDRLARFKRATFPTLMADFHRVAQLIGRDPTRADILERGRLSPRTYNDKIGPWPEVTRAYHRWLKAPHKSGGSTPYTKPPETAATPTDPASSEPSASPPERGPTAGEGEGSSAHLPEHRLTVSPSQDSPPPCPRASVPPCLPDPAPLGQPLAFRGLLHAPTTELGVIHLFGLLHDQHGIAVEHIGHRFPDCTGVREERMGHLPRWRRVRIEFEYRSSSFRAHGHDPQGCDLIVCWEHDWQECPIEVLELKNLLVRAQAA